MSKPKDKGQVAYEAWEKAISSPPYDVWEDLHPESKAAWAAAEKATLSGLDPSAVKEAIEALRRYLPFLPKDASGAAKHSENARSGVALREAFAKLEVRPE